MASFFPKIASWHQEQTTSLLFEVIAIDDKAGTIEVQYADGDIAEYDIESWGQLDLMPAHAPEDANSGYEMAPEDDLFNQGFSGMNYNNPIESIEPESFGGLDDFF